MSLLRPKINSLEDGAKEVAFSTLNHLITSEKKKTLGPVAVTESMNY